MESHTHLEKKDSQPSVGFTQNPTDVFDGLCNDLSMRGLPFVLVKGLILKATVYLKSNDVGAIQKLDFYKKFTDTLNDLLDREFSVELANLIVEVTASVLDSVFDAGMPETQKRLHIIKELLVDLFRDNKLRSIRFLARYLSTLCDQVPEIELTPSLKALKYYALAVETYSLKPVESRAHLNLALELLKDAKDPHDMETLESIHVVSSVLHRMRCEPEELIQAIHKQLEYHNKLFEMRFNLKEVKRESSEYKKLFHERITEHKKAILHEFTKFHSRKDDAKKTIELRKMLVKLYNHLPEKDFYVEKLNNQRYLLASLLEEDAVISIGFVKTLWNGLVKAEPIWATVHAMAACVSAFGRLNPRDPELEVKFWLYQDKRAQFIKAYPQPEKIITEIEVALRIEVVLVAIALQILSKNTLGGVRNYFSAFLRYIPAQTSSQFYLKSNESFFQSILKEIKDPSYEMLGLLKEIDADLAKHQVFLSCRVLIAALMPKLEVTRDAKSDPDPRPTKSAIKAMQKIKVEELKAKELKAFQEDYQNLSSEHASLQQKLTAFVNEFGKKSEFDGMQKKLNHFQFVSISTHADIKLQNDNIKSIKKKLSALSGQFQSVSNAIRKQKSKVEIPRQQASEVVTTESLAQAITPECAHSSAVIVSPEEKHSEMDTYLQLIADFPGQASEHTEAESLQQSRALESDSPTLRAITERLESLFRVPPNRRFLSCMSWSEPLPKVSSKSSSRAKSSVDNAFSFFNSKCLFFLQPEPSILDVARELEAAGLKTEAKPFVPNKKH